MGNNRGITLEKSEKFAIKIVNLYKDLVNNKLYDLGSQILRSGTSIGANLTEASYAISKKDFFAKVYISLKECAETKFWLNLLYNSGCISKEEYDNLMPDCLEILKLLTAITKTLKLKSDQSFS